MISYIRGYYVITVEGVSVERFLNHLMRNGIKVYNVKKISSTKIEFHLEREDIKAFKNVYRGSNFQVKIKQSTGLPFILRRIYKNKGMWICGVISLFLLIMTSQFVTDIYIQVPEGIKKEDTRKELYQVGLKPGVYKKSIDRKIVRENIHRSIYYNSADKGIGPRYCPSMEDKIAKFPERTRHQIILEREGYDSREVYPNGFSTSLPVDAQLAAYRTIKGLENCQFISIC